MSFRKIISVDRHAPTYQYDRKHQGQEKEGAYWFIWEIEVLKHGQKYWVIIRTRGPLVKPGLIVSRTWLSCTVNLCPISRRPSYNYKGHSIFTCNKCRSLYSFPMSSHHAVNSENPLIECSHNFFRTQQLNQRLQGHQNQSLSRRKSRSLRPRVNRPMMKMEMWAWREWCIFLRRRI